MQTELSLIRFNVTNFFALLLNHRPFQPITTIMIKVVNALIRAETSRDEKMYERVEWLKEHTHEKVELPLAIVELVVFKNLDKNLDREVDIWSKSFNLADLYRYIDEVTQELTQIVIDVAKKYTLDIPINIYATSQKINLE